MSALHQRRESARECVARGEEAVVRLEIALTRLQLAGLPTQAQEAFLSTMNGQLQAFREKLAAVEMLYKQK